MSTNSFNIADSFVKSFIKAIKDGEFENINTIFPPEVITDIRDGMELNPFSTIAVIKQAAGMVGLFLKKDGYLDENIIDGVIIFYSIIMEITHTTPTGGVITEKREDANLSFNNLDFKHQLPDMNIEIN
jgi:hypothetical protein